MELVHTGVLTQYSFETLVTHWGDLDVIVLPPPTLAAVPFLDGLSELFKQMLSYLLLSRCV